MRIKKGFGYFVSRGILVALVFMSFCRFIMMIMP